jgi:hypothetical protein
MRNVFVYNERLGVELPILDQDWDQYTLGILRREWAESSKINWKLNAIEHCRGDFQSFFKKEYGKQT